MGNWRVRRFLCDRSKLVCTHESRGTNVIQIIWAICTIAMLENQIAYLKVQFSTMPQSNPPRI